MLKISSFLTILLSFSLMNASAQWYDGAYNSVSATNYTSTMSRTGSVTVGSDGTSWGIGAFEVGQSNSSLWSAFIRNGSGSAKALRVKAGFYNGTDPVFQVEANSADANWNGRTG